MQDLFHIVVATPKHAQFLAEDRVRQTVVHRAQHADHLMRQRKCLNHIHKSSFIKAFLRRCHDVDQQLSGPHAAAQDQIAQQTLVALFVVERITAFLAELQHRFQYRIKIRMH